MRFLESPANDRVTTCHFATFLFAIWVMPSHFLYVYRSLSPLIFLSHRVVGVIHMCKVPYSHGHNCSPSGMQWNWCSGSAFKDDVYFFYSGHYRYYLIFLICSQKEMHQQFIPISKRFLMSSNQGLRTKILTNK